MKRPALKYLSVLTLVILSSGSSARGDEQSKDQSQARVPPTVTTVLSSSLHITLPTRFSTPSTLTASLPLTVSSPPLSLPRIRAPQLELPVRLHIPLSLGAHMAPQVIRLPATMQPTTSVFYPPRLLTRASTIPTIPPALTALADFNPVTSIALPTVTNIYSSSLPASFGASLGFGATFIQGVHLFDRTINYMGAATQMISPLPAGTRVLLGNGTMATTMLRTGADADLGIMYSERFDQTIPLNPFERFQFLRTPAFLFDPTQPFRYSLTVRSFSPPFRFYPQAITYPSPFQ